MESVLFDAVTQVPLVAIIVWFVLVWTKRSDEAATERARIAELAAVERAKHADLITQERNAQFQVFIETQNEALRNVLTTQAVQLAKLVSLLDSHDRITEAALIQMFERMGGRLDKRRPIDGSTP